jgi:predicted MFS family arabinose efflux permease
MGVGSNIAGMAYTRYGYLSNTVMGALSMAIMAAVVAWFLPEPTNTE